MMREILSAIAAVPAFSGLAEHELIKIKEIAVEKTSSKGAVIFSEGDKATGFFVVVAGQIKIYKLSPEGKEQILHIFGPGEPVGEVPVFTGRNFPANAQAISSSHLLFFPRAAFLDLISRNPSLSLNMLAVLSKRLRQFTVQIENLSLKEVPGRLASYLIVLADEQVDADEVTLPISKGQLASLLGTIPETLSRIFNKMGTRGLIMVNGRRIRILDRSGLEETSAFGLSAD
jgi:CRP/FNR family transcriptional regulator